MIETRPGVPLERRLADIHARVGELLDEHRPDAVAIEELYFGANVRTAFAVGQARGVVLLAAGQRGDPVARPTRPSRSRRRSAATAAPARTRWRGWSPRCSAWPRRRRPTTPPTRWPWRSATSTARRWPRAGRGAAGGRQAMIALVSGEVAVRRADHVVVDCGGVGYRLAVSAETLRHVPAVGQRGAAAHPPGGPRRRAGAVRLRHRGGARPVPDAAGRPVGRAQGGAGRAVRAAPPRELLRGARRRRRRPLQAVPGIGKRTAERIIVELREKVGATLPEDGRSPSRRSTTRARSPATAWSGSATAPRRPTSCSTARRASAPRS